ncbi:MAG: DNA mismatch repair endonuclease MutL [Nitrospiraceae bacterium]|nr:DNA mismatch repair endonuclease MutL [Nitrospiraceae bacterium]
MGIIRILPDDVRDKLRAGEVVERPASAMKELVENSIDAGATRIEVEIRQGGKKLIRVSDNGTGMGMEDALMSLQRHATSKLARAEDLSGITTLGFRGEALPSISSVSFFSLKTAPEGEREGVEILSEGGQAVSSRPCAALGTTVEARDLFYNVPARKKFMKSDSTESLHVIAALTKQALSHPETGFILRVDGEESMNLPQAGDERERIAQLYGAEFMEGLIETGPMDRALRAKVFFSREGNWRGTKGHQFIFINRRPVRDASIAHAVYAGLEAVPQGRHPVFFLFIEADPGIIDVNVHPQKEEVRFRDKDVIYRFIMQAVRSARRAAGPALPDTLPPEGNAFAGVVAGTGAGFAGFPAAGAAFSVSEALPMEFRQWQARSFIRLGEMFYACTDGEGVTLFDQHAAHERVLFEKLLKGFRLDPKAFLFPRQIKLPPREYGALVENRALLDEFGIQVEDFGQGSIILRAVPEEIFRRELSDAEYAGVLMDAAAGIIEKKGAAGELKRETAARIACHSSVRGGERLSPEELQRLLEELEACEDPDHCPHGRPARIVFGLDGLKRIFKRK